MAGPVVGDPCGWRGPQIPYSMDPTICTNQQRAYLTVTRDTSGSYRILEDLTGAKAASFSTYGSRKFGTRPGCAMLPPNGVRTKFILVGRGSTSSQNQTDTRLFWSQ